MGDGEGMVEATATQSPSVETTAGSVLTREMLDTAFDAILKRGSVPRHVCRFDGHVLQWNPLGFAWCVYCHKSEADLERPRA